MLVISICEREIPVYTEIGISDFTPKWHQQSGKLLGTGHTVTYNNNHLVAGSFRRTIYSVYDPASKNWSKWASLRTSPIPSGV